MAENLKKKNEPQELFTLDEQKVLISYLVSDHNAFALCRNIIKPEYFESRLKSSVKFILEYAEEFKIIPAIEQIKAKTKVDIEKFSEDNVQHTQWFLSEIEKFCKHKAVEQTALDALDLINAGEYGEYERRIKEAVTISLVKDLGTDYYVDPELRLKRMLDKSSYLSTGWESLDKKLYGGFQRGTLNVFAGGSGCVVAGTMIRVKNDEADEPYELPIEQMVSANSGTRFLADSPDGFVPVEMWRNKGIKDIYEIILENGYKIKASDDHLFQSHDESWIFTEDLTVTDILITDTGTSKVSSISFVGEEVVYDLAIGHENHRYYTNGICSHNSGKSLFLQNLALNWSFAGLNVVYISLELYEPDVALRMDAMLTGTGTIDVVKNIGDTALTVTRKGFKSGKLIIKKLPEGGTTSNTLRAFLKEYEIKTGIRPDALVVDYLDLMYPNSVKVDTNSFFVKDKYTSEEMRGLAGELDCLCVTASQLNRQSVDVADFDHSHIAGGISKINTADNVFAILSSAGMKERGIVQIQFLKCRNSNATGQNLELAYDPKSMRISDSNESQEDTEKPLSKTELKKMMASKNSSSTIAPAAVPEKPRASAANIINELMNKKKNNVSDL